MAGAASAVDSARKTAPTTEARSAPVGGVGADPFSLNGAGEVVQLTRQVAYVESTVTDADGAVVSRAMATFIVRRKSS